MSCSFKGLKQQLYLDGRVKMGCYGVQMADEEDHTIQQCFGPAQGYTGRFKDATTGQILKDDLVIDARRKELEYFCSKEVWIKVPATRARQVTGRPPISTKWVDVSKGDECEPNYRSRLVARQIKARDFSGDTYFAPAPPLEALRTVLSLAATRIGDHQPAWDPKSSHRM